jgi:hypothetical protein
MYTIGATGGDDTVTIFDVSDTGNTPLAEDLQFLYILSDTNLSMQLTMDSDSDGAQGAPEFIDVVLTADVPFILGTNIGVVNANIDTFINAGAEENQYLNRIRVLNGTAGAAKVRVIAIT